MATGFGGRGQLKEQTLFLEGKFTIWCRPRLRAGRAERFAAAAQLIDLVIGDFTVGEGGFDETGEKGSVCVFDLVRTQTEFGCHCVKFSSLGGGDAEVSRRSSGNDTTLVR